jgi:hypothetical protein
LANLQIIGVASLFATVALFCDSLVTAAFLIGMRFLIPPSNLDMTFVLVNANVLLTALVVVLMPTRFPVTVLVSVVGLFTSLSVALMIEMLSIALFAFSSILFFQIRNHRIGNDNQEADPSAIKTVATFLLSFVIGFCCFSKWLGAPQLSAEFWNLKESLSVWPVLSSKLAMSSVCVFFSRHDRNVILVCIALVVTASLFRFIPLSTPHAKYEIAVRISAHLLDIASLVFIAGSYSRVAAVTSGVLLGLLFVAAFFLDLPL